MREASGIRVAGSMVAHWVVESWDHGHQMVSQEVPEFKVFVSEALAAAVVAEAEVLCAMDAVRERVS